MRGLRVDLSHRADGAARRSIWRRLLPVLCLALLTALPLAASALWPREERSARKPADPRYASQTGTFEAARRKAVLNARADASDHAVETCGAFGLAGLAAKFGMAPDVALVAARYARDFEVSVRGAWRRGCVTGLREGG